MKRFIYLVLLISVIIPLYFFVFKNPIVQTKQQKIITEDEYYNKYYELFNRPLGFEIDNININEVIQIYGKPIKEEKIKIENRHALGSDYKDTKRILIYKDMDMTFYRNYITTMVLKKQTDKMNKKILINVDFPKKELEKILGVSITSNIYSIVRQNGFDGVWFYFDRDMVSKIVWDYPID
jgi:hypothetical protein